MGQCHPPATGTGCMAVEHCEEVPAHGIGAWSTMGPCHSNALGSKMLQDKPPTARACSTEEQSSIGGGHHEAVPLMAYGHGALWG